MEIEETPQDFYIILDIKAPKFQIGKIAITVATSTDNWEKMGLKTKIGGFQSFIVEDFSHRGFIELMHRLIEDNSYKKVHIVGDKYMIDMVPKFGFHAEFNGNAPTIKKLVQQLNKRYLEAK